VRVRERPNCDRRRYTATAGGGREEYYRSREPGRGHGFWRNGAGSKFGSFELQSSRPAMGAGLRCVQWFVGCAELRIAERPGLWTGTLFGMPN
jgi:hypothetical protein